MHKNAKYALALVAIIFAITNSYQRINEDKERHISLEKEITKLNQQIKDSDEKQTKYKKDYILKNPKSTQSAYYLFELGKPAEANAILKLLIERNDDEAIYADAAIRLDGTYLSDTQNTAKTTLNLLCEKYIEPCIKLSEHLINKNKFDDALKHLKQAENSNDPRIYSSLMYIYSIKSWGNYNIDIAKEYGRKIGNAKERKNYKTFQLNTIEQKNL